MATTTARPRIADDETALYWELERLRVQLDAAAEEYGVLPMAGIVAAPFRDASATIAEVQVALAEVIVKTAGPAAH